MPMRYHPLPEWLPENMDRRNPVRAQVEWYNGKREDCWVYETRPWSDGWVACITPYYERYPYNTIKVWADCVRPR